ncbi:hypothetical protein [Curvivirga aplysinae]|uniref:hypothetical protein n=1 Tax=Curvivirga aplysinae TaxID=2529852 RepID=UPI001C3F77BA|nr:hypothetical protein [Curvivirga aplysinae]
MTLQKKVNPLTRSGVAGLYIEILGAKEAAAKIGLKAPTLYNAANDEHEYVLPSIDYYVELDRACVERGYPAPFASWLLHKVGGEGQAVEDLTDAMLVLHSKTSHLTDTIRKSQAPDGPGGTNVTPNEKADIFKAITGVNDVMNNIKSTVEYSCGTKAIPIRGVAAE